MPLHCLPASREQMWCLKPGAAAGKLLHARVLYPRVEGEQQWRHVLQEGICIPFQALCRLIKIIIRYLKLTFKNCEIISLLFNTEKKIQTMQVFEGQNPKLQGFHKLEQVPRILSGMTLQPWERSFNWTCRQKQLSWKDLLLLLFTNNTSLLMRANQPACLLNEYCEAWSDERQCVRALDRGNVSGCIFLFFNR